jgi:4-hydroxybutyryl-CoA dehydratase/vinylacetyl-CoA-Delta-isomerase
MAVKTEAQYYESLKKVKPTAYVLGEKITNIHEHPLIKGQVASVAQTYALAHDPEGEKLLVAESALVGEKVNRFVRLLLTSRQTSGSLSSDAYKYLIPFAFSIK